MTSQELIEAVACFAKAMSEFEDELNKLFDLQSLHDKKKEEMIHKIELTNFNAAQGYAVAKELQLILHERRINKNQIAAFNCFRDLFYRNHKNMSIELFKTITQMKKSGWNNTVSEEKS